MPGLRDILDAATPPKPERWWQVLGRIRRCDVCGKDLRANTLARLDRIGKEPNDEH